MRFLIAFDKAGIHVRKTLCVIHRYEIDEIHYHAEHIFSIRYMQPVISIKKFLNNIFREWRF